MRALIETLKFSGRTSPLNLVTTIWYRICSLAVVLAQLVGKVELKLLLTLSVIKLAIIIANFLDIIQRRIYLKTAFIHLAVLQPEIDPFEHHLLH